MVEKIGQIMGRHSIHKKPMTATEYQRRWRAKKRRKAIWSGGDDATARRPTPKRADKDFWPTPPELQRALVRYVLPLLPVGPVWEPAAGDGALADALAESGRNLILSDIDPQRSGILRRDFLKDDPPAGTQGSILITNPPFIEEVFNGFCDRALQMLDSGHLQAVVLLARADKLGAQGRAAILNRATHVLTVTARTRWLRGSGGAEKSPRWWFVWITWLPEGGPPTTRWINRADLA
jgi:hypothetical protein